MHLSCLFQLHCPTAVHVRAPVQHRYPPPFPERLSPNTLLNIAVSVSLLPPCPSFIKFLILVNLLFITLHILQVCRHTSVYNKQPLHLKDAAGVIFKNFFIVVNMRILWKKPYLQCFGPTRCCLTFSHPISVQLASHLLKLCAKMTKFSSKRHFCFQKT